MILHPFFKFLALISELHVQLFGYQSSIFLCSGHPWICDRGVAPDRPLDPAVLSRIKQFSAMNKLKKMALQVSSFNFVLVDYTVSLIIVCNNA
jgi:hypothetical protein